MDDRLYQVRVIALATDRIPLARIHAAFAELLCLSLPEAEARLAVLPLLVRGGLGTDLARKYERVLGRLGLVCELLPEGGVPVVPPGLPLPAPEDRDGSRRMGERTDRPGADRELARAAAAGARAAGEGDADAMAAPAGGPA